MLFSRTMSTHRDLLSELEAHHQVLRGMGESCGEAMLGIVELLRGCFDRGSKLLIFGNGGSAADAQHVAGELVNRMHIDRRALAAIALTTDASVLTSVANDSAFDEVYARQVQALARAQDVVCGMSTSGRSRNVLNGLTAARRIGAITVGMTGQSGRETMSSLCDLCLAVPSDDTPRIQEAHMFAWHFMCARVEESARDCQAFRA